MTIPAPNAAIVLVFAIALLLFMISYLKFNPFMSLIIASIATGILMQMPLVALVTAIKKGAGETLGGIVLTLGFGVMLGSILSETGAAQRISSGLIRFFGEKRIKLAMVLTGFIVGIAMFYNAGFIILIPLLFSVVRSSGQPVVYLGLAMASSLSITHGFLPPHPGPIAVANIFKADIGLTLAYGFLVAIPAMIAAGIIFPEFRKNINGKPLEGLFEIKTFEASALPSFAASIFVALVPVLLMGFATVGELTMPHDAEILKIFKFIGDPNVSMLIAVLVAFAVLGKAATMKDLIARSSTSLSSITMVLLITGAGGAFKEILSQTGISLQISNFFIGSSLSPLLLGWLIATLVRVCIGSATIAGLTAAGIVQPLVASSGVSPELMVLAIGAGSLMLSHLNDTGFWIFKEYFSLSVKDTFKTWTLMETIVGVVGLGGVLVLQQLI